MKAIFEKEWGLYFSTPIGYVFLGIFAFFSGLYFWMNNILFGTTDFYAFFNGFLTILLIIVPILTMRSFSEERKTRSDQLLLTAPISVWDIILGKFLAAFAVYAVALAITLIYPLILAFMGGSIDWGVLFGSYIGYLMLGIVFIAVGLFVSNLTESQVVAVIGTIGLLLIFVLVDSLAQYITILNAQNSVLAFLYRIFMTVLSWFALMARYETFSLGMVELPALVYYLSFAAVFLFLTGMKIEQRRWN